MAIVQPVSDIIAKMTFAKFICIIFTAILLQGCIASTIIEVAAETVEAGVEVTSAVVGGVVDVVTPNDEDDEDDKENAD